MKGGCLRTNADDDDDDAISLFIFAVCFTYNDV